MTKSQTIAGGAGSDPLECDGCGLDLDVEAHITAGGEVFCGMCAIGTEQTLVADIGVYQYVPDNPRLARQKLFSASNEQISASAVVGDDWRAFQRQEGSRSTTTDRRRETIPALSHRKDPKYPLTEENKNHLLTGHQ